MQAFIPREKLGKKARRELDKAKRASWNGMNPVTRRVPDKTKYDRKKTDRRYDDYGSRFFVRWMGASPVTGRRPTAGIGSAAAFDADIKTAYRD